VVSLTDGTHLTATVKTPSICVLIVLDFIFDQALQMNAGMHVSSIQDSRIHYQNLTLCRVPNILSSVFLALDKEEQRVRQFIITR
jgi:hypothetical protein